MVQIAVRAEDKNRWERRAPLTPDHVRELVTELGIAVRVEPSPLRAFSDRDYREAGAEVDPDFTSCRVILGIKEIPLAKLLPGKTYLNFSHVTKGQRSNMPTLARLLELGSTLVDYERIADRRGRRLVFFGRHAGYAGMLDTLWALGQRLAWEGLFTPLEHLRRASQYSGLEEALHHVARIGEHVRHRGLAYGRPVVAAFTGSGNVTKGALEVFDRLPVQEIDPEEVKLLAEDRDRPRNVLFKTLLGRGDRYRRRDGAPFDAAEFLAHPELYESALGEILPHLTLLVHGAFWELGQPEIVTREQLQRLFAEDGQPKLRVIGDITCDIGGAIAATVRATDPGDPVYVYRPDDGGTQPGLAGPGVVVMAVDNLPCQLPVEASHHFGDSLIRFIGALTRCDWDAPFESLVLPPELRRAIIVHRGALTPEYRYLERHLPGPDGTPSG